MNTIEQVLVAGETTRLPGGKEIHIMEVENEITVSFIGSHGKVIETARDIREGLERDFGRPDVCLFVEIYSASNQSIQVGRIEHGTARYNRMKGDVTIDGELEGITNPIQVGNFPSVQTVQPNGASLPVEVTNNAVVQVPAGVAISNSPVVYVRQDNAWNAANQYQFGLVNGTVSGKYPQHTVWNPTGSGKNILVHSAKFLTDYTTPQYGGLKRITALPAMSNVYMSLTSIYSHNGLAAYSHPFTIRSGSDTTQQFSMTANTIIARTWLAHDSPEKDLIHDPNRPIILTPGRGLTMCLNLSANDAQTSWLITVENA